MNIKDIIGKRIAVHCKTEKEAEKFIKMAYDNGCRWRSNQNINVTYYNSYGSFTCYNIDSNRNIYCGSSADYNNDNYQIINFNEIDSIIESYQLEIKRKDNKTIATLKDANGKYIKHVKAVCSPDDEYDYEIGKKIALSRLFDIESVGSDTNNKHIETKVEPFKPYLTYKERPNENESLGIIGEPTNLTAYGDRKLYVGDVVELFDSKGVSFGLSMVCKNDVYGYFIMGIAGEHFVNGKSGTWLIVKQGSYEDLLPNTTIGCVKAVFPEQPA